jgi:cytochrome c biogenesis protein CcmG/thiol:disulfide interchange protein DsbE
MRAQKLKAVCAGGAVLAILLTSCASQQTPDTSGSHGAIKVATERKPAPDFTLADHTGKPTQLSSLKGKVVLLNFWATWCGPCKVEIPWFIEFQQKYRDQDFVVLGVSLDEDGWKSVRPYMEEKKINYRIMIGNEDVAKEYGGLESLPTTLMLDKEGRIASTHVGLVSKSSYQSEIEYLLNGETKAEASAPAHASNRGSRDSHSGGVGAN